MKTLILCFLMLGAVSLAAAQAPFETDSLTVNYDKDPNFHCRSDCDYRNHWCMAIYPRQRRYSIFEDSTFHKFRFATLYFFSEDGKPNRLRKKAFLEMYLREYGALYIRKKKGNNPGFKLVVFNW